MELLPAHFTIESMVKKFKDRHARTLKESLHLKAKALLSAYCNMCNMLCFNSEGIVQCIVLCFGGIFCYQSARVCTKSGL